jgi:radical SAM protein with 4Fe4S-binding SPASM domain
MISLSKLISGEATVSKHITYKGDSSFIPKKLIEFSKGLIPIVVWNVVRRCNLKCVHCYADAKADVELTTDQCLEIVDSLSDFGIPLILFSGGEPLLRKDLIEIAEYARKKGINCVLSTNGTLIDKDVAEQLKDIFSYVGVSIDGLKATNDRFRGVDGAFEKAMQGLLNAKDAGMLTGIRFTVTKYNIADVPEILKILREEEIPRFCLYHLVPSGRADFDDDISREERRKLIDYLIEEAKKEGTEIMTVDNPADGIYVYLKLKESGDAEKILEFLKYRGGDSTGIRLANIDFKGEVHPNQFWWDYTLGNLFEKNFEEIWLGDDELLKMLREKTKHLRGKCGSCRFKDICGGFRLRALRYGDLWGEDPDCYLTPQEIR